MIRQDAANAVSLRSSVLERRSRAEDIVRATIERIEAMEPQLRAWETLAPAFALEQARELDRRIAAGAPPGLIAGVPLAVKDIFDTAELPTGYGSPLYRGCRPAADAQPVATARRAGAIVMGKTVTTEFAYFTPGPTRNPWSLTHTPGGSSSGSAAAVASGMVPLAFGSQTAGSLIRPASYCGVFAIKPTHGRFGLEGVKPFAPSLDTLGWLARSADDLELMRCALAGEPFEPLGLAPTPLRLAASVTHEAAALDDGGRQAWRSALSKIDSAGFEAREFDVPAAMAGLLEAQKTVMAYEAARSLASERRSHRELLSAPLLALLEQGDGVSSASYRDALALADRGREQANSLMQDADALLVPAAPGEAPEGLGATGDPVFSRIWTLLGLPCVNVPGLLGPRGLPIGLQLVGLPGSERALLQAAAQLHTALDEA